MEKQGRAAYGQYETEMLMTSPGVTLAEAPNPADGDTDSTRAFILKRELSAFLNDSRAILNRHFENDERIMELGMDAAELQRLIKGDCLDAWLLLCPPLLVFGILLGIPCAVPYRCCTAHKATDAHHLVLRTNSLQLSVDPYPKVFQKVMHRSEDDGCFADLICWPCFCRESTGTTIMQTIPLQEIEACAVEPGLDTDCCGVTGRKSPNTLMVTLTGTTLPVFAVDCPANGEDFARRVMERVMHIRDFPPAALPAEWGVYKERITLEYMKLQLRQLEATREGALESILEYEATILDCEDKIRGARSEVSRLEETIPDLGLAIENRQSEQWVTMQPNANAPVTAMPIRQTSSI
jgi:hypothetical protein